MCAHFLTHGWKPILLIYLPRICLCSLTGIALLAADHGLATPPPAAPAALAHHIALPAFETACQAAIIDCYVLCGFPELVFTALLACEGPPLPWPSGSRTGPAA